jgi:diguanylate cyclase (GGDEF)-like protein
VHFLHYVKADLFHPALLEGFVLQNKLPITCWGFGLSLEQEQLLRSCLGDEPTLSVWSKDHIPSIDEMETNDPCLLWLSSDGLQTLLQTSKELVRHLDLLPKALLLENGYSLKDFENASDNGVTKIVRPNLTPRKTREILRHALEVQAVHTDMLCMTREIMLERELLERKNDIMSFLVGFLTAISGCLDLNHILQTTFHSLNALFPVHTMQAALWQTEAQKDSSAVSLHITAPKSSPAYARWHDILIEQTRFLTGNRFTVEETCTLDLPGQAETLSVNSLESGSVICLPITTSTEKVGVLVLLTETNRNFGRDQALALESALQHLALTIKNAHHFHQLQLYADYDALTRVHSRRHFEQHFKEEMDRFYRYHAPLSMIMADIDHFKHVNDSRGHHAGDIVLHDVASIISKTIRTSDYCARYGGEEFILLLPHTDKEKAFTLAERLRNRIAKHTFNVDGGSLQLTISLGVSTLVPGMCKGGQTLLYETDSALYEAKENGRNHTCESCSALAFSHSAVAAG